MTPPDGGGDPFAPLSGQMLDVGDGHSVYVETVGRADGIPAVYLHGGPGSGCQPSHRRLFDPRRFRAVLFDQRGAGRSQPARSREHNTIQHLIADMERVRTILGIDRWLVVGGSWGATLGLAYAQAHPERVIGIVLRATFLGTRAELEWAFGTGLRTVHPGLYDDFLSILTPDERLTPLDAYFRRILDPDLAIHGPAARAWHDTERVLSEARPGKKRLDLDDIHNGSRLPTTAFMEAHYFVRDSFLTPDQLLAGAGRLKGIRGVIVQGRFDLLCPPATSYALAKVWGNAEVVLVEGAGHAMSEPGVSEAVVAGINALAINHPRQ